MLVPQTIKMFDADVARPLNTEAKVSENIAVTGTVTYYSAPISLRDCWVLGVQAIWTGTPTGTLTLEVSNDRRVQEYWEQQQNHASSGVAGTWTVPATGGTFPASPAGSASSVVESFGNLGYSYARIKYVNASGSGNLKVFLGAKGS